MQRTETLKVKVLRSFYFRRIAGAALESSRVGEILDLPKSFALEMCAAKKAEVLMEEVAAAPSVEEKKPEKARGGSNVK